MSWTFLVSLDTGQSYSAVVHNPEWQDVTRRIRRQAAAQTAGGVTYVQDLGVSDRFIDAEWDWLSNGEKGALQRLFEEWTLYQARPFRLTITGGVVSDTLRAGAAVRGVTVLAGATVGEPAQVVRAGQEVQLDTVVYPRVRLDQSSVEFEQTLDGLHRLVARFRVERLDGLYAEEVT